MRKILIAPEFASYPSRSALFARDRYGRTGILLLESQACVPIKHSHWTHPSNFVMRSGLSGCTWRGEPYPRWTAVGVNELITPGALVEIRVVAIHG